MIDSSFISSADAFAFGNKGILRAWVAKLKRRAIMAAVPLARCGASRQEATAPVVVTHCGRRNGLTLAGAFRDVSRPSLLTHPPLPPSLPARHRSAPTAGSTASSAARTMTPKRLVAISLFTRRSTLSSG